MLRSGFGALASSSCLAAGTLVLGCGDAAAPRALAPTGPAQAERARPAEDAGRAEAGPDATSLLDGGASRAARLTTSGGCSDASREAPRAMAGACIVRGKEAFVFHVRVRVPGDRFLELGVYGADVSLAVPNDDGAPASVTVHAPLELNGVTTFETPNVSLVLRETRQIHPALRVAAGAPAFGVAVGGAFRARFPFGLDVAVGPVDLPCDALSLGGRNRVLPVGAVAPKDEHTLAPLPRAEVPADPHDENRAAKGVSRGRLHLWWKEPPLLRATPDDVEGLRLLSPFGRGMGGADFEIVGRKSGFLRVRLRSLAGSELNGWVKETDVSAGGGGGRGEGIGLCGCGSGLGLAGATKATLAAGASVHLAPNDAVWARVPAPVEAFVSAEADGGWRRVLHVDRLSEGGDGCDGRRLEHAWVRDADVSLSASEPAAKVTGGAQPPARTQGALRDPNDPRTKRAKPP